MKDTFLTNKTDLSFLDKLKDNLKRCNSFCFSVSFIKKAGLVLIEREIEDALDRGVNGKIITSTYQNFTDIPSLELFLSWTKEYENFECHLDFVLVKMVSIQKDIYLNTIMKLNFWWAHLISQDLHY